MGEGSRVEGEARRKDTRVRKGQLSRGDVRVGRKKEEEEEGGKIGGVRVMEKWVVRVRGLKGGER